MARTNQAAAAATVFTHEGAPAFPHMTTMQALRRSVLSCLLWENEFYEDGAMIADRIRTLALAAPAADVASLAMEARNRFHLRHAPLWLLCALVKTGAGTSMVRETIARVVQRVDEIPELIAMYWTANPETKDLPNGAKKHKSLPGQMKKGLAEAFGKFKEYHFAKYDRDTAVKLRDALFLCHAKPADEVRAALYKRIAERSLETPDTWEVALSGGGDKKETFERLIREGALGYLALLRNLRNMAEAGCDSGLVRDAILARKGADRILPFRYVAALRAAPQFAQPLDTALQAAIDEISPLPGLTVVLVDVSGSMRDKLSAKSDLSRMDAAATLASIIPGEIRMFSFADSLIEVPAWRGMAGIEGIVKSQSGGTRLFDAVAKANELVPNYQRLIVITDEQAAGPGVRFGHYITGALRALPDPLPGKRGYMVNVASAQNGVGYGKWLHLDGFSENIIRYIAAHEAEAA